MTDADEIRLKRREIDRRSYVKHKSRRLERAKRWRANNREKVREIKRNWARSNPDRIKEYSKRRKPLSTEKKREIHRKNRYGITPEMFDAMLVEQKIRM